MTEYAHQVMLNIVTFFHFLLIILIPLLILAPAVFALYLFLDRNDDALAIKVMLYGYGFWILVAIFVTPLFK